MKNKVTVSKFSDKLFVYKYMTFGDWLRRKIKDKGWTNAELARRVSISATYVGDLVRGYKQSDKTKPVRPSEQVVADIAKVLSADLDEARAVAGYIPKSVSRIPEEIAQFDFTVFDKKDLDSIADFIPFKTLQKQAVEKTEKVRLTAEEVIERLSTPPPGLPEGLIPFGGTVKTEVNDPKEHPQNEKGKVRKIGNKN